MNQPIKIYSQEISRIYQGGDATEHSYRPALKQLIQSLGDVIATNEPKRVACGAPDFVVKQRECEIGHIEAKDIGVSLDKIEKSDQLQRYLNGLNNLILSNHLEFRWYVGGELRLTVEIGKITKNKLVISEQQFPCLIQLIQNFLAERVIQVRTPQNLAKRMAGLAQLIRDAIKSALTSNESAVILNEQYNSFKRVLIADLSHSQFADMYAQTIVYGLFAARFNTDDANSFSRKTAGFYLPKTNPFLRSIFGQIAGIDLDERIAWAVDILAEILKQTNMAEIMKNFGRNTRQEDPVFHFYETFLAEYDSEMREKRGVYYTPQPVVSYIVRSIDYILKERFNINQGLADSTQIAYPFSKAENEIQNIHKVLILDPAVGTGTFIHAVINHIYLSFASQKGMWSSYVSQHLLPRLFGFELLMAPYTVAHMKLGLLLQKLGYDFNSDERLRIYLTNTLQETFQIPPSDGFMNRIIDEAESAKEIKQEHPVMVILGNPPYSGHSANRGEWIKGLLNGVDSITGNTTDSYFQVDGQPLGEKNPKWLNDDYVKFIRFSQWRIDKTGFGVLGFVTNHGYLDNPTFRGMRQSLMKTFDEIYVLDLHGNKKKKELCPDGSPDQNVFDIQQGVSIGIFIKNHNNSQTHTRVYHADLWGMREVKENDQLVGGKYKWLAENNLKSTEWQELQPSSPFYLFCPQNVDLRGEYEQFWKITDIMPVNSVGIVTARDNLTIRWSEKEVWNVVNDFVKLPVEELRQKYNLGKDSQDWKIDLAQKDIKESKLSKVNVVAILYRPFDKRFTYYTGNSGGFHCRARQKVMRNFLSGNNLNLITVRKTPSQRQCNFFMVSDLIISNGVIRSDNQSIDTSFPLYIYPSNNTILQESEFTNRHPNLADGFIKELSQKLGLDFLIDGKGDQVSTFAPEDIFNYIYAVFHSPTYRTYYAEFLKIDFPRVPITSDASLFWQLVNIGDRLVKLHLMKVVGNPICTYPIAGSDVVEKVTYDDKNQRVYINKKQYFDGVPINVWKFYIGGYQVCDKWLKDRKNRVLIHNDLVHYQNIISIIAETIIKMEEIDKVIAEHGGFF